MKATTNTNNGSKTQNITACYMPFSEKELEKLTKKFNREVRVLEFVGGCTYFIQHKNSTIKLKSSSLDELLEMYKCSWKGIDIPERKCFFHK